MAEIAGLKLIVPSSVAGSGVSVSASGKVTFTAATSVSVNGCFTSSYDNYLIVCRASMSTNVSAFYRLRASGTDNSTANSYVGQVIYADNTTVGGARTTENQGRVMGSFDTDTNGVHFYVYGPNLAQPTAARSVAVSDYQSAYIVDYASTHNQSTAYDGFSFLVSGATWSGSLCVYGLSQ